MVKDNSIQINWLNEIKGDFEFKNNWTYPEGVYKNEFGQLSCDGFCPEQTDRMKQENSKIINDSLHAFYNYVDTTHCFQTMICDAWCYEYAGTNYITVERKNKDTVYCYSQMNAATHCSLKLNIVNDMCFPIILLNSISSLNTISYTCIGGQILIDKKMWQQGIMKAVFSFTFEHTENLNKPMFWKGKIYSKISS